MNEANQSPPADDGRGLTEGLGHAAPERGNGGGLLDHFEREALSLLSAEFGTTTGDLAQQMPSMKVWDYSRRAQSQNMLTVLHRLQACGLVKRMDDQKPIAWILARPNV